METCNQKENIEVSQQYPRVASQEDQCTLVFEAKSFLLKDFALICKDVIKHVSRYSATDYFQHKCYIVVDCGAVIPIINIIDSEKSSLIASAFITHDKQDELNFQFEELCSVPRHL